MQLVEEAFASKDGQGPFDGAFRRVLSNIKQVYELAEARAEALSADPTGGFFNSISQLVHTAIGAPIFTAMVAAFMSRPVHAFTVPALTVTGPAPAHKVEVVHRVDSTSGWAWQELLRDRDSHFKQQNFHERQVLRDADLIKAFKTDAPHSGDVVLLYNGDPPKSVERKPHPVILVHGASKNGNYWKDESGLADELKAQGFQVFAVSFAHNHDDNFFQAQALANCIDRVKKLCHVSQVDVVAHSKGGVAARAYCSNFRHPWMTEYRNDVRRLILAAVPNGGIDYSFRHPVANYVLAASGNDPRMNAPMTWQGVLTPLGMLDMGEMGFSKNGPDYFPGQRQLLTDLSRKHSLPWQEQDWYTTYYGGRGFVSRSPGLKKMAEESDHFMDRMRQTPVDPSVEVCLLAGNRPNIPNLLNEYTGPSDGLLFLSSALELPPGTNLVAQNVLRLNHKSLVDDAQGTAWIANCLTAPTLTPPTEEVRKKHAAMAR